MTDDPYAQAMATLGDTKDAHLATVRLAEIANVLGCDQGQEVECAKRYRQLLIDAGHKIEEMKITLRAVRSAMIVIDNNHAGAIRAIDMELGNTED